MKYINSRGWAIDVAEKNYFPNAENRKKYSESLHDQIAEKIDWLPINVNYKNNHPLGSKYKENSDGSITVSSNFKNALLMIILFYISIFFILLLITKLFGLLPYNGKNLLLSSKNYTLFLIILIITTGIVMYFYKYIYAQHKFNIIKGIYYPYGKTSKTDLINLSEAYALQITWGQYISKAYRNILKWGYITELCRIRYELNFILKDGTRIFLVDDTDIENLHITADKLSLYLGIPIWEIGGVPTDPENLKHKGLFI